MNIIDHSVQVVQIKREMNWDEEERRHQLHVRQQLQEQADSSSDEDSHMVRPRKKSSAPPRKAISNTRMDDEAMVSRSVTFSGMESAYEDRAPPREAISKTKMDNEAIVSGSESSSGLESDHTHLRKDIPKPKMDDEAAVSGFATSSGLESAYEDRKKRRCLPGHLPSEKPAKRRKRVDNPVRQLWKGSNQVPITQNVTQNRYHTPPQPVLLPQHVSPLLGLRQASKYTLPAASPPPPPLRLPLSTQNAHRWQQYKTFPCGQSHSSGLLPISSSIKAHEHFH